MILILLVFIPPTLAIAIAVPSQHISLTAGIMQAFKTLLTHFDLSFLEPVIAIGLVVASISGLLDWLTGPSTGLVHIGRERGYLPRYFQQVNANGVQLRIVVAQGIVITVIGLLYAVVPSVSRAYWVFAALATEVDLIMAARPPAPARLEGRRGGLATPLTAPGSSETDDEVHDQPRSVGTCPRTGQRRCRSPRVCCFRNR